MEEIWKEVKGFKGLYEVSNYGRCVTLSTQRKRTKPPKRPFGHLMKGTETVSGYLIVRLTKNKIGRNYFIHRLVATAFIPNPKKKLFINHIDFNRKNNFTSNIEWVTMIENNNHSYINGRSNHNLPGGFKNEDHPMAKLTNNDVIAIKTKYRNIANWPYQKIADYYKVSYNAIYAIKSGKTWSTLLCHYNSYLT